MLNMNNNRLIINPNIELNTYETSRIIIHAVIKLSVHRTISKTTLVWQLISSLPSMSFMFSLAVKCILRLNLFPRTAKPLTANVTIITTIYTSAANTAIIYLLTHQYTGEREAIIMLLLNALLSELI